MVILVVVVQIKFFSIQPFEEYFKVVAAQVTLMRHVGSNWTSSYVDVQNTTKVQCLILWGGYCKEEFENVKPPWVHS